MFPVLRPGFWEATLGEWKCWNGLRSGPGP